MKLKQLDIRNFRAFEAERILFNDYTCMVGPNGSGKSTVLAALRVFFRDGTSTNVDLTNLKVEDFHLRKTEEPIQITATFYDLEPEAQEDFKHYCRNGLLIVSAIATWDPTAGLAPVKQFGQRLAMEQFAPFFKAEDEGASLTNLKPIFEELRQTYTELPPASNKLAMLTALRAYESAHPDLCSLVKSDDQFYGFSKGTNLLQKYIQWVCVPAVKDASTEQLEAKNTALKTLLERTVRSKVSFKKPLDALRESAETRYRQGRRSDELSKLCDAILSFAGAAVSLHGTTAPGATAAVEAAA